MRGILEEKSQEALQQARDIMLLWGWSFIESKGVRKGREKEKEWGAKTCLPLQKNSGKGERKSGSGQCLSLERPFVSANRHK